MSNLRGDEYPSDTKLDSFDYCKKFHDIDKINKFNKLHNILSPLKLVLVNPVDRTCHWRKDTLFVYKDALVAKLRFSFHEFIPLLLADLQINPCQLSSNTWRIIICFIVFCLRGGYPLSIAVF